jgi:excisionase family DNA binding protein
MPTVDELLTVKDAAEFLKVSPNTIRNWTDSGKIPFYRHPMSNYRLFRREDLEEVLRQIDESGHFPTGWSRPKRRKPR